MKKPRTDGQATRGSLLAAAEEVFAAKGFWEATIADICARAGANSAAVNYHFRSKEDLYVEAWKSAFGKSLQSHPQDGGVPAGAPVFERLGGMISSFMRRIADPLNHDVEIMHKEMACPTGILNEAIQKATEPQRLAWDSIIREMLGPGAEERTVRFCHISIMALCFGPMLRLRRSRSSQGAPPPEMSSPQFDVETFARHTAGFIFAGVEAARAGGPSKAGQRRASESKRRTT